MALPDLRHFENGLVLSDVVEASVLGRWIPSVYTSEGWLNAADRSKLWQVAEWRHAQNQEQQDKQNHERIQERQTAQRQTRTRKGTSGQKP